MLRPSLLLRALTLLGAGALVGLAACGAAAPPPAATAEVAVTPAAAASAQAAEDAPPPDKPARLEPPPGYVEVAVLAVIPTPQGSATVLLGEADKRRIVPIHVGGTEALSIALRMDQEQPQRPLTHDLLDAAVRELGGELVKVQVDSLRGGVFIGTVFLRKQGRILSLDARPSDAVALALGSRVPIFMAREVIEQAGEKGPGETPP